MPPTTMTYGDYSFTPVPMMDLTKAPQKTEGGEIVGAIYNMTLDGSLSAYPTGGLDAVDDLQDELRAALDSEGSKFRLACGATELMVCYPRVLNFRFEPTNNNWVFTTDYTIEFEFDIMYDDEADASPYISDYSESWTVEFLDDHNYYNVDLSTISDQVGSYYSNDVSPYSLRVTHDINAHGKAHYSPGAGTAGSLDKNAWEEAQEFVIDKLGFDLV
ncbi:MAG: hypothetical protein ACXACU_14850 [Candidatus Hodarchaeales archaeon]|jgi:hypothetical protein